MATRADLESAAGRPVLGSDGIPMGVVTECSDTSFVATRHGLFRKSVVVRYADVAEIGANGVVLSLPSAQFIGPRWGSPETLRPLGAAKK